MKDVNSKGISYFGQFGILIGLTGGGMIVGTLLSGIIWMMMTGTTIPTNPEEILQAKYYYEIMVFQAVSTFFTFFVPAYFFAFICYHKPGKFIGFNTRFNYKQVLIVIGIMLAMFPLSAALGELNKILPIPMNWTKYFKGIESEREAQEAALIQLNSVSKYLISLFIIALLPAIFEEVLFRAGLQNLMTRWIKQPWTAIIITSIIFSLIHLSYYGFLVRFGLGVALGVIYYYSGSIWLNILFHFLVNGIQVSALYFFNLKKEVGKTDIETSFPWWTGIVALAVVTYLIIYFINLSKAELAKYPPDKEPSDDFENWLGDIS
jgi:uncharacterized protein